jgi:hypothetical protein
MSIIAFCILLSHTTDFKAYIIAILVLIICMIVSFSILIWLQPQDSTIDTFKVIIIVY